ncbi:MAG: Uma2 family endonuclease [Thiolinea sp.]
MTATAENLKLTPDEYLQGERDGDTRHEYIHGQAYAMAGAGDAHNRVSGNAFALLKNHLRGSDCSTYMADMKVRINADEAFLYPDVMITCDPADHNRNYYKHAPILIIEVLSPRTEGYDRGGKFALYRELDSLQEYVLIDPRVYRVDIFRRNSENRWELYSWHDPQDKIELKA